MVRETEKPSLREASCCRVDVVNGAAGLRFVGLVTSDFTVYSAPMQSVKKALASASVLKRLFSGALIVSPSTVNSPTTRKSATGWNPAISRSRSTMIRTATLWTRPALSPGFTFFQSTGLRSKPTSRSKMRRACWAFTKLTSTVLGFSIDLRIAVFVISEKTMRLVDSGLSFNVSYKCHEMASPSRSSSVASHTTSALDAACLSSFTSCFLSSATTYLGSNPLSTSTLSLPLGRSRMCP